MVTENGGTRLAGGGEGRGKRENGERGKGRQVDQGGACREMLSANHWPSLCRLHCTNVCTTMLGRTDGHPASKRKTPRTGREWERGSRQRPNAGRTKSQRHGGRGGCTVRRSTAKAESRRQWHMAMTAGFTSSPKLSLSLSFVRASASV